MSLYRISLTYLWRRHDVEPLPASWTAGPDGSAELRGVA